MKNDKKFAQSHLDSILKLESEYQIDNKIKKINNRYFGEDLLDISKETEAIKVSQNFLV